jgi:hypothetical protein
MNSTEMNYSSVNTPSSAPKILALIALLALAACVAPYKLVSPGRVAVAKKSMSVLVGEEWNRIPKGKRDTGWDESWTLNGPLLDTIAFVGGLPDGQALVKQLPDDNQQVPTFHRTMTPDDLVSMIESYYRIGGITVFEVKSVEPTPFLGGAAVRMDYDYVSKDELPRKGRCVMRIVNDRLYLMKLEGAASHYFNASVLKFNDMVSSAEVI